MSTPKMTDKLIAELRDRAADFGFVLAGRCRHCLRPISSLRSLKDRSGPVCAVKHKENDPSGAPAKKSSTRAATHIESNS